MLIVAVLGILAAIASGKYGQVIRRSYEARTKGNLGTIRSAIAIYYADSETLPEDDLACLIRSQKYLRSIPMKYTPPYHPEGNDVGKTSEPDLPDVREDWVYFAGGPQWGRVLVNCVHTDLRGVVWTAY